VETVEFCTKSAKLHRVIRLIALIVVCGLASISRATDWNSVVLEEVAAMPTGGGYSISRSAKAALQKAIGDATGPVNPAVAKPSFCSGATYLVLLKVLERAPIPAAARPALAVGNQPDGVGVWGRWNANGPGTARLFYELNAGRNFTELSEARPGDFLKIFWTDEIGSRERGHSVVFLGTEERDGEPYVRYWSSNQMGGYGVKAVSVKKIGRMLFSRLERPDTFALASALPGKDAYLAAMLVRPSAPEEMARLTGSE